MPQDRHNPSDPCAVGDRIELDEMGLCPFSGNADPCPIPAGTQGTVTFVSYLQRGEWQIGVKWDVERSLMLIYPIDRFHIITPPPAPQGPEGNGHDLPTCRACGAAGTDDHENCANCNPTL